jgi:SAM-dependent methyltransferase
MTGSHADDAAFFDALAPRYDAILTSAPLDRWTRRAFQTLVAETVPRGSLLLDFGCGTGLDAAWYAGRGYRVLGYDISEGMLDQLRRRCASEIAAGTVVPVGAPFRDFARAIAPYPRPQAVVSNFSFLVELAEPQRFFDAIAPLLAPGAPVVLSVLNPFFWKDVLHRWWWVALTRSAGGRRPAIVTHRGDRDAYRHSVRSLVAAARPAFHLEGRASVGALVSRGRGRGPLDWDHPASFRERLEARLWKAFFLRSAGMFVFLTFRRA